MYVGGTASYETVEDSFQHNLQLVKELIDDPDSSLPSLADSPPAIEVLIFTVNCSRMEEFVKIDNATWSNFLIRTPGFQGKHLLVPPGEDDEDCQVWSYVEWASRSMWKSIGEVQFCIGYS
jgi:hypothetical protein